MPNSNPEIHRRQCREAQARYVKRHPEKVKARDRNQHYRKSHGITTVEFNALFLAQNSVCAACFAVDPGHRFGWQLDHDHLTGRHRGILCHPCNMALGAAKDSATRLRALLAYLGDV